MLQPGDEPPLKLQEGITSIANETAPVSPKTKSARACQSKTRAIVDLTSAGARFRALRGPQPLFQILEIRVRRESDEDDFRCTQARAGRFDGGQHRRWLRDRRAAAHDPDHHAP